MPSWKDGEKSSDDDINMVRMEHELFETPDTVVDPTFCGSVLESKPKRMLHGQRPNKMVAFEGSLTGRRFQGCPAQWVDGPWLEILQRCLAKLCDMYHEQNLSRVKDTEAHDRQVAKLKKENEFLANNYSQLVNDVSNLFDYQDGLKSHDMDYTSQAIIDLKEKKKQLEDQARIEVQMVKVKLAKEQRCILQSQEYIIQNTRKAMKEAQANRDLLKDEKKVGVCGC